MTWLTAACFGCSLPRHSGIALELAPVQMFSDLQLPHQWERQHLSWWSSLVVSHSVLEALCTVYVFSPYNNLSEIKN